MGIVETRDLVFEYIRRDKDGEPEGVTRADFEKGYTENDIQIGRASCRERG